MKHAITITALLTFLGCATMATQSHNSDKPPLDYKVLYINSILEYLKTEQIQYIGSETNCYQIYRQKGIDKYSCAYEWWNNIYYSNHVADSINTFKKLQEANSEIDYSQIKHLLQDSSAVHINLDNIDYCVEIVDNVSLGTYTFSPLIPFHNKNRFEVWLTISMSREDFYYLFRLTKKGDQYIVNGHQFEDFCFSPSHTIIGDWIKDLDTKPIID